MGKTGVRSMAYEGCPAQDLEQVAAQILLAIRSVQYGSVEVVIQDSKVVQIERKEKFRFDKPAKI